MKEKPIYERQDYETDKSYPAFCVYRDMGPDRSIERAHDMRAEYGLKTGSNLTGWKEWSRHNNWVDRAKAYDIHIEKIAREAKEQQILRIATKSLNRLENILDTQVDHVTEFDGYALRPKSFDEMEDYAKAAIKKLEFKKGDGTKLELYDALAALRDGLKLSILRVDQSEQKVTINNEGALPDLSGLTEEEMEHLLIIQKKLEPKRE